MNRSERVDQYIAEIKDWRAKTFAAVRKCFLEADPEMVEEFKWMGTPTWSCDGLIAVANAHKDKVKITFAYGASFPDADQLFNSGFEGNARRAIDIFEGDKVDERALKNLIRAAIAYNRSKPNRKAASKAKGKAPAGAKGKAPARARAKSITRKK